MRKWRNVCMALALFGAGCILGGSGVLSRSAGADPAAQGVAGSALIWTQDGDDLQMTVVGSDATYLGVAGLEDGNAWPQPEDPERLIPFVEGTFDLDLGGVSQLTFYRLEPVGTLSGGFFRPCDEIPGACFPVRPPGPPPWPTDGYLMANGKLK